MEFLKNVGYSDYEINDLNENIPNIIKESIIAQNKLVMANLSYLINQGIENYKEVFSKFYEVFLLDHSEFTAIFDKYEKEDLIKYLKNNVDIIEYL